MVKKIKQLAVKYRELLLYGVFGVLTTVVNYLVYLAAESAGLHYMLANAVAWAVAVLFAYAVNRKRVFESRSPHILPEFARFVGSRLFSLAAESAAMALLVDVVRMDNRVAKLVGIVINVVINYFLGKLFVFKKSRTPDRSGPDKSQ